MMYPTRVWSHDPLAVAVGNASLLGVGYWLLRRRGLAVVSALVTFGLLAIAATVARTVWFEIVVLLWWAALILHGWILARGRDYRVVVRWQRVVAFTITIPVLAGVGFLRFDAARIESGVTDARAAGDCARASSSLDRVWLGHRVVDAPLVIRGEMTTLACQRLRTAENSLTEALAGDTDRLDAGFDGLIGVLAEFPGHEKMVDTALDGFLGSLPVADSCHTVLIADWLRQRPATGNTLDRSAGVVPEIAPSALAGCGDGRMAVKEWAQARTYYQRLLAEYPDHELTGKARESAKQATLAIELAEVTDLLKGSPGTQPAYCTRPARYSAAAPYGPGVNRALIYGNADYTGHLPAEWRAGEITDAVLVVCADDEEYGAAVRTCPYQSRTSPGIRTNVTFHKVSIRVRAYELRTGQLVIDGTVEIGGASCPPVIEYTSFVSDLGPPSQMYVNASVADIRTGFESVINE